MPSTINGLAKQYSVIVQWSEADHIYVVTVPELPGCMTHGRTRQEAIQQAEDAIDTWLDGIEADDVRIPAPHTFSDDEVRFDVDGQPVCAEPNDLIDLPMSERVGGPDDVRVR